MKKKRSSDKNTLPYRTVDMIGNCQACFNNCKCSTIQPESNAIFLHMHGGGFISQTSKSHQTYLIQWSKDTGIPILRSIRMSNIYPYIRNSLQNASKNLNIYKHAWYFKSFVYHIWCDQ